MIEGKTLLHPRLFTLNLLCSFAPSSLQATMTKHNDQSLHPTEESQKEGRRNSRSANSSSHKKSRTKDTEQLRFDPSYFLVAKEDFKNATSRLTTKLGQVSDGNTLLFFWQEIRKLQAVARQPQQASTLTLTNDQGTL